MADTSTLPLRATRWLTHWALIAAAVSLLCACGGGGASPDAAPSALDAATSADPDAASSVDPDAAPAPPDVAAPIESASMIERASLTQRCEAAHDASACADLASMMIHGIGGPRAYAQARTLAERACKGGVQGACADLAHLLARGHGGKLDLSRAITLLRKSCDASSARACSLLGHLTLQSHATARDPSKAIALLESACDMGSPNACHTLASLHTTGVDAAYDLPAALTLLERACQLNHAPSCLALADRHRDGFGATKDPAKATAILTNACESQNIPQACLALAHQTLDRDDPAATAAALPLFERACQPPDTLDGCRSLALLHIEGRRVPRDLDKGLSLLQQACDLQDPSSCERLSQLYSQSKLIPRDLPRALSLLERACDLNPYFCADLAAAYDGSISPPLTSVNPEKAIALRERACDDHPARCVQVAWMYLLGTGIPQNPSRATDLFARACDADPALCQDFASLYTSWERLTLDLTKALPLFEQACSASAPASCTQAAEILEFAGHAGVTPEPDRSLALFDRACKLGDARGCLQLMRRDPTHATLQRCSSTNLLACDHIAAAYRALSTDVTQNWSAGGVESPLPLILAQAKTHLSRACDLGHGPSCLLLGHWSISIDPFGAQIVDDAAAAEAAYQRACDARLGDACTLLSMRLLSRNDTAAAAVAAKSACDLDDVAGCIIRLRRGHLDGMRPCERSQRAACTQVVESLALRNTDDDAPTRYAALTRACDLRYGLACRTLSSIHAGSEGPPPNADFDSRHFLEKACAAGDELSCSQVDLEYEISIASGKHVDRAVAFYEKACAAQRAQACRKLADLHRAGTLVTRDAPRMLALYEQSCDAGDAQACAQLGQELARGAHTPADPARAQSIFLKSCQRDNHRDSCLLYVKSGDPRLEDTCLSGDTSACTALETGYLFALMEADGEQLRPRFIDFYRKRCDHKQPAGCRGLGNIYRDATGVPQDVPRARGLHERACLLEYAANVRTITSTAPDAPIPLLNTCYGLETLCGFFYADQASCVILGSWHEAGIVLTQDTARSTEFFRQACAMGWSSARCTALPAP
jgi:uncharacterized protein